MSSPLGAERIAGTRTGRPQAVGERSGEVDPVECALGAGPLFALGSPGEMTVASPLPASTHPDDDAERRRRSDLRSAVLIFNPAAGRGRARELIDALLDTLRQGGYRAEAWPTEAPGSATRLAADAADAGTETVFAYGGDGTLREAAVGLLGSSTTLGFIPGGTVNVMTLTLGLPERPLRAAKALCAARVRELDVGLCDGEPFLMQASAGLDAAILARLSSRLKKIVATGALAPAGLSAWLRYGYPKIELVADGERLEGSFVAVCNIPFYGGKWVISPAARADDRKLDLVLFTGRGRFGTLGLARDLLLGNHLDRPDVETRQVEIVELLSPGELPVQIDGDALACGPPLRITLAPYRLRVLAP